MNTRAASEGPLHALLSWQYLAILAALLVAGQLLAVVFAQRLWTWRWGKTVEVALSGLGVGLLLSSAWAWAWVWFSRPGTSSSKAVAIAGASCATLLGVAAFCVGRGNRLRLQVEVMDNAGVRSEALAAFVAARLDTMGAHKPRGLDAPRGTDVTTLPEDALSTLPQGKLASGVYRFVRQVLSITPWYARIVLVDGETVSVEVERFWRPVASTVIFRRELGLDRTDPKISAGIDQDCRRRDLLTAAAAFLLIRLSEVHTVLQPGLCGATKWRSLACQVLAAAPPWESDDEAYQELLARAVDKDPLNYAARLAYYISRSGRGAIGDTRNERQLADRLKELCERVEEIGQDDEGLLALRMRIRYSMTTAYFNSWWQDPTPDGRSDGLRRAEKAAEQLISLVNDVLRRRAGRARDKVREFAEEMRPSVQFFDAYIKFLDTSEKEVGRAKTEFALQGWTIRNGDVHPATLLLRAHAERAPSDEISRARLVDRLDAEHFPSLWDYYNRACLKAISGETEGALADLDVAVGMEGIRKFAPSDPYLSSLWSDARFSSLLDGDQSLVHLEALEPHAKRLAADGIRFPEDLLRRRDDEEIAKTLDVPVQTVDWIRGICLLATSCPRRTERMAWTNLLTREDLNTLEALQVEVERTGLAELTRRLRMRAIEAQVVAPDEEQLRQWVARLSLDRFS